MSIIITISEAVEMIRDNVKGASFVSIDCSTEPKMNKGGRGGTPVNPYHGKIRKLNTLTGCIGFDYESSVNRLATKEDKDEREAKSRKWGQLTSDRLFVTHNGGFYLQMKVESSGTPRYILSDTGGTVHKEVIKDWLPKPRKSSTQADLEGEVVVRDVKMVNVKSMRFNGETYTIVGEGKAIDYEAISASIAPESAPASEGEAVEA